MELYPIYDENSPVSPNIWYSLSGVGETPMMRVGHTLVHIRNNDSPDTEENKYSKGKLYFVGGANPSNCFNDIYFFDLDKLSWDKHEDLENFESGRYEHACVLNEKSECIVFGGASEKESFNDVLKFNFENKTCEKFESTPSQPSARTIHVGASYKNQMLIFGGGQNGKTPVDDQKVYIFNATNKKWISLSIQGSMPSTRHGHVMMNFNDELVFMHGGMRDENILEDLWSLNLKTMSWSELNQNDGVRPCSRAAHGGICINKNLYIFGGINSGGSALDDLWKYDIGKL